MTQPMITKTIRVPYELHKAVLQHKHQDESFTAYVNRLLAEDLRGHDALAECVGALSLCVAKLEMWPEGSNPEFFPCVKAGRAVLERYK